MKMMEIASLLDAKILCGDIHSEECFETAFSSDMMSDALAFGREQSLLLTGLMNQQVIRTAEMIDIHCVVFVRGKVPAPEIIELAAEKGIAVMTTAHGMFSASGILYAEGIRGGA